MALKKYKELTSLNDETLAKDLAEATANTTVQNLSIRSKDLLIRLN
ncbi:MAG: hypothetical protein IPJ43_18815 [Saprospiraceae bacterium]|nr:hypothetical protein [Saprospiraceae bacterium]